MPDIVTIAPAGQRLVSAISPVMLRRIYSEAKLNDCIRIEVPSNHEGITYHSHTRELRGYLAITNLNPFLVCINRIEIETSLDGGTVGCVRVMPVDVKSGQRYSLLLRGCSFMPAEAIQFAKANAQHVNLSVSPT